MGATRASEAPALSLGHAKVVLGLGEDGRVRQARLPLPGSRAFEAFVQGRSCWELPALAARLHGLCPVSHQLAAAKALDALVGARRLTPAADRLRRLLNLGQILQAHALHGLHLSRPDLLFGFERPAARGRLLGVLAAHPDPGPVAVAIRQYGQEVIHRLSGPGPQAMLAIPGGVARALAAQDREALVRGLPAHLGGCQALARLARELYFANETCHQAFASFPSNSLSLVAPSGALELYDGGLRARDGQGRGLFEQVEAGRYGDHVREAEPVGGGSAVPFLTGQDEGWYRVGPLARLNNADLIATPLAETERRLFRAAAHGGPMNASLASHWARMVEMLSAAEGIEALLADPETMGTDLVIRGERALEGIGVVEAPRGLLVHQYRINGQDQVEQAHLVVATTHNHEALNRALRQVAARHLKGRGLTPDFLQHLEVAIRAWDPCLPCATHALGRMPMDVELRDADGRLAERMIRNEAGRCG